MVWGECSACCTSGDVADIHSPSLVVPRVSLLVGYSNIIIIMLSIIIPIAISKHQSAYLYLANPVAIWHICIWLILLLFVCSTISVFGCLR